MEEYKKQDNNPEKISQEEIERQMINAVTPFIKDKIKKGELRLATFGNHDHLEFVDENFWGHYVMTEPGGLQVTMYQRKDIKGDSIYGERGPTTTIFIKLDDEDKKLLSAKIRNELESRKSRQKEPDYEWHEWDDRSIEGLEDALYDFS